MRSSAWARYIPPITNIDLCPEPAINPKIAIGKPALDSSCNFSRIGQPPAETTFDCARLHFEILSTRRPVLYDGRQRPALRKKRALGLNGESNESSMGNQIWVLGLCKGLYKPWQAMIDPLIYRIVHSAPGQETEENEVD